ncbi:hypothetical protein BU17DRAFT_23306, partial [Hysterangium stoloniferum]
KSIELSTYGIIFLGTPHQNIRLASTGLYFLRWGKYLSSTNGRVVQELEDPQKLSELSSRYTPISRQFRTVFFYETRPVNLSGVVQAILVNKESAIIPGLPDAAAIGLNKDHVEMVKFGSDDDDDYNTIRLSLQD